MLIFRKIIKIFIFMILIFLISYILSFILIPNKSRSKEIWQNYFTKEKIDTLFVGSSIGVAFKEEIINKETNWNSLNMSGVGQKSDQVYIVIEEAIKKHKIKQIILGFGYFNLEEKVNIKAEIAFKKNRNYNLSVKERILKDIDFIFSKEHIKNPESINYMFDWIYNSVPFSPTMIINNIKSKIGYNEENSDRKELNYNNIGDKVSTKVYSGKINPEAKENIRKIIKLCKENNIEFIIINTPHPVYDILYYGNKYFILEKEIKEFFKELKVSYYDFNLIKPSIFKSKEDYFVDFEHMSKKGTIEFSKSFVKFMKLRENDENMSKYFYTPEEYLASIKHISIVDFDNKNIKEGVNIVAKAYTGSKVNVEYEMLIYDDAIKKYKVIRKYDQTPSYFYPINENKKLKIRVNARQIGTDIPYEKYYEKEIVFKK